MPLIDRSLGFELWYLDDLPGPLRSEAEDLVGLRHAIDRITDNQIIAQYYRPLGERVRCDVTYGLPALLYVLELRSQKTIHPTLRRRVLEVANQLRGVLPPFVAMHIDNDPSDWDLRRGQQSIRRDGVLVDET